MKEPMRSRLNRPTTHFLVPEGLLRKAIHTFTVLVCMTALSETPEEAAERLRKQAIWDAEKKAVVSRTIESVEASPRQNDSRAASSPDEERPVVTNVRLSAVTDSVGIYAIRYDLEAPRKCKVSLTLKNGTGETIPAASLTGCIGEDVNPGRDLTIMWNAAADWPDRYSENVYATVTAEDSQYETTWVSVEISWNGGRDLDVCGYWTDRSSARVGWSWSASNSDSYWTGDNTGPGPEFIRLSPVDSNGRKYKIHCNFYGETGSGASIKVTGNGVTLSKSCGAGSRNHSRAETSDPGVVITFGDFGQPVSIDTL